MNFEIPPGLTDLLQDFTVAVLKDRPDDLVSFAAEYFNKLNATRDVSDKLDTQRGVRFASPSNEPMQTEQDDDDDEPMSGNHTCTSTYFVPIILISIQYSIGLTTLDLYHCSS